MSHAAIDPYVEVVRARGLVVPLALDIRAAYRRAGQEPPVQRAQVAVAQVPIDADLRCCHCGLPVPPGSWPAALALSGFEHTDLRLPVLHCDACARTEACDPETRTPGSGVPEGVPGGYCVYGPRARELVLGAEIVPGLRLTLRLLARALAAGGLLYYMSSFATLLHSQGQMTANGQGGTGAVAIQDSTSGHGYNAGAVRVFSGSAPAAGGDAEAGTLGVNVPLPNPCFGAGAGFPVVWTAGAIGTATIAATITANYFRMVANGDGGGVSTTERRIQGDVATASASMNVNTTAFVAGGAFNVVSLAYTGPP